MKKKRNLLIKLVVGISPWIIMFVILFPRLSFASQNLRMIEVTPLGRDEGWLGGTIWGGWKTGAPTFFSTYGYAYNNIVWVILKILSFITPITQQITIIVSRAVSLTSFLFTGLLSFFWIKKRFGIIYGMIFVLLLFNLLVYPDFIFRTTSIQPDLLNLLAIMVSFFLLLDLTSQFSLKKLIWASISFGFVMAVKFAGFLFIPFLFISLLFYLLDKTNSSCFYITKIIYLLKKLFFSNLFVLTITVMGEIIWPTNAETGYVFGLTRLHQLYFFQFLAACVSMLGISILISKLLQSLTNKSHKWIHAIAFMYATSTLFLYAFGLSVAIFSSKSIYRLNFLNNIFLHVSGFDKFYSPFSLRMSFIFVDTLGIVVTFLFLLASFYYLVQWILSKSRLNFIQENKIYLISLVWAWTFLIFFSLFVQRIESRYLYILYPAVLLITSKMIVDIYSFSSIYGVKYYGQIVKNMATGIIILSLLLISFTKIQNQILVSQTEYNCLACLPGVKAGLWLDKNYQDNNTKIIQETSVYIPERFNNHFFPWGDQYQSYESYQPDVIFIRGIHLRYVRNIRDEDFDGYYLVKAEKTKLFFSDLISHRLPFRRAATFGSEKDGNDIIVFARDNLQIK